MKSKRAPKKRLKKMKPQNKVEPAKTGKVLSYSMNLGKKPEQQVFKPRLPHAND